MQVGASNEMPESEELDALFDRFLIRRTVSQVGGWALWGGCRGPYGEAAVPWPLCGLVPALVPLVGLVVLGIGPMWPCGMMPLAAPLCLQRGRVRAGL